MRRTRTLSILEVPRDTWLKRFMQRHYSYRDFHQAVVPSAATPTTYVFGTNARAVALANWPNLGDWVQARTCYARKVTVLCPTQDAWVVLVSLNPRYLILTAQGLSAAQIATMSVTATLTEVPQFVPRGASVEFNPTYGTAIVFYGAAGGTLSIWVEGNVEGTE